MINANDLRIGNSVWYECDELSMTTQASVLSIKHGGKRVHSKNDLFTVLLLNQWGKEVEQDVYFLEPIPVTENALLEIGFTKTKTTLLDTYGIDISRFSTDYKEISLTIQKGNQYVYLRQGDVKLSREEDDLIVLFNSDIDGELYVHYLQNIYFFCTKKELVVPPQLSLYK